MAQYDAAARYALEQNGLYASRTDEQLTRRYVTYVVRQGDTLESIASRYLGNPRRFWELADLNPQVKFPLDLGLGTVIRLPS